MLRKNLFFFIFLTIFCISFSDIAYIAFQIYIDTIAPNYTSFGSNVSEINKINESILFYSFWNDGENGLLYKGNFSWNVSGWKNESYSLYGNKSWFNVTKVIDNVSWEGKEVYFKFYVRDWSGNYNATEEKSFVIVSKEPNWSDQGESSSSVNQGENISLWALFSDNFIVYNATLQFNDTGSWTNNYSKILNCNNCYANFTINTSSMQGTYYWRIIGRDKIGNENATAIESFTVN